ncbi:uncharacterized protein LOC143284096 [Babylonia areolata]|uniref:uncharacterized protein LOC143284096 n=1 Tax=Babylonia areolata TaxID=304850 RepID=UPI003FD55636
MKVPATDRLVGIGLLYSLLLLLLLLPATVSGRELLRVKRQVSVGGGGGGGGAGGGGGITGDVINIPDTAQGTPPPTAVPNTDYVTPAATPSPPTGGFFFGSGGFNFADLFGNNFGGGGGGFPGNGAGFPGNGGGGFPGNGGGFPGNGGGGFPDNGGGGFPANGGGFTGNGGGFPINGGSFPGNGGGFPGNSGGFPGNGGGFPGTDLGNSTGGGGGGGGPTFPVGNVPTFPNRPGFPNRPSFPNLPGFPGGGVGFPSLPPFNNGPGGSPFTTPAPPTFPPLEPRTTPTPASVCSPPVPSLLGDQVSNASIPASIQNAITQALNFNLQLSNYLDFASNINGGGTPSRPSSGNINDKSCPATVSRATVFQRNGGSCWILQEKQEPFFFVTCNCRQCLAPTGFRQSPSSACEPHFILTPVFALCENGFNFQPQITRERIALPVTCRCRHAAPSVTQTPPIVGAGGGGSNSGSGGTNTPVTTPATGNGGGVVPVLPVIS